MAFCNGTADCGRNCVRQDFHGGSCRCRLDGDGHIPCWVCYGNQAEKRLPSRGKHDWIQTYTGRAFYPLDPDPNDVSIDDIAHALSNMCRFTGHTREFYSVAQHSVMIALLLPRELALEGLLHDAAEAYLLDVARPVKYHSSFNFYRDCEKKVDAAIRAAFSLQSIEPDLVKQIDKRILPTERRDLMGSCPLNHEWQAGPEPYDFTIVPWQPARAKQAFLELARDLRPAGRSGALPAWGSLAAGQA